ncbi:MULTISPECIES: PilZ domain-containing protein [unclassified Novosphingobium]|uniref:PilZ domain-containing protein n=1 Tax=unclassified Novosphingobium TaxID=2644732 RepID=UPI001356C3B0|nr:MULTISPECIES: PilZ domain-containing protein [unclassified Novosphingobium]
MTRRILPRRSQRRSVALAVQCRTQSGLRDDGEISDISTEGCCLRMRGLYFRVGSRLIIRPKGLEGMPGVVRWVSADLAGVEFDRPIYGPVLDHLASAHAVPQQA